jgi:Transcriptional regulators
MAKNVTLADIAAKVGVSNVAVYKALTGKPGVSARLREEIIRLAEEMGYTAPERGQNARKTGNIGVIVPEQYYG